MSKLSLVVRRLIDASPERLFEAWTTPAQMRVWWGPKGVRCIEAELDARVGGRYRIGNELPDGNVIWIAGEFLRVEPPTELVYSWSIEPSREAELVTVRFEARGALTEVIITHERLETEAVRDDHARGWDGCLDGLANLAALRPR